MAMLTAAFDGSGQESDKPYVVVAGFVSRAKEWIQFSEAWAMRLAESNIPHFHMTEFLNPRHRPLVRDLVSIILSHVFQKFSVTVQVASVSPLLRTTFLHNAYSLAGRIIVSDVQFWKTTEWSSAQLEYVFADGDDGKGKLMDAMYRDGYPAPIFKPGWDQVRKGKAVNGFLPLQAADILANRTFAAAESGPDDILEEFNSLPTLPRVFTFEDLQRLEDFLNLDVADPTWRNRFDPL